jgi:hypothetical protein
MAGALCFLLWNSWKNRLALRFKRLRQPRYFIGLLVGLSYAYFYVFKVLLGHRTYGGQGLSTMASTSPETHGFAVSLGALMFFLYVVLAWIFPHDRAALVFTEAEVAFLFPAPVTRRTLIRFKLLKSQLALLFTTLLFTVIFGRWRSTGSVWTRLLGWWVILSTMNLHTLGCSFARTMLLDRGISNWRRRVILLALLAALGGGVGLWAWHTLPPPPPLGAINNLADIQRYGQSVLDTGALHYLLYPFRVVVRPYLAPNGAEFLKALGPALILMGLHYLWVVRSDVAFEEASLEMSRRVAERRAAIRAGKRQPGAGKRKRKRPPFKLNPTGIPVIAFLWKNLICAGQAFTLRLWLALIWGALVGGMIVGNSPDGFSLSLMLGFMALLFLGMSFLMGPQLARQDFRMDLPMADLIKTYPLPSWQVALGELLAPLAILTGVQWCLIALVVPMIPRFGNTSVPLDFRLAVGAGLAIVAPAFDFVSLLIPNAAVLLFPGWFQTGPHAPQGIEATGQRLIFALGQLLALILALAPAAIIWFLVWLAGKWLGAPELFIPLASAAAAVVMIIEGVFGVFILGTLFARFDVSSESAPG